MRKYLISKRKVDAIANGALLIGIGILVFTGAWWPGILLVLWVSLGARQYLSGRKYDFFVTSFVLLGLFVISFFKIEWAYVAPVLFTLGGLYIIFREFLFPEDSDGEEKSQEIMEDADIQNRK